MTDKQIIIDGVDVSGCHNRTFYKNDEGDVQCKCYRFEDADSDTLLFGICKQHPHCYYKQLNKLKTERDSYIDKYFVESQKVLSIRKVLKKIKEVAERDKEFCIKCNGDKAIDCIECIEGGRALLAKEILQKISEVEDG